MNTIYRIVWNAATGKWVVASELAKGRKKKATRIVGLAVTVALGLGVGGNVAMAQAVTPGEACTMPSGTAGSMDSSGFCMTNAGGGMGIQSVGTLAAVDDSTFKVNGSTAAHGPGTSPNGILIGNNASGGTQGTQTANIVIGAGAQNRATAASSGGLAVGRSATLSDMAGSGTKSGGIAIGDSSAVWGAGATALGARTTTSKSSATTIGAQTTATAGSMLLLGTAASLSGSNNVALGGGSQTNRANTVALGTTSATRQLVNVAGGTQASDAVTIEQFSPLVAALGSGATIDPTTGAVTGPSYSVGGTSVNTVAAAVTNLDGRTSTDATNIADLQSQIGAGTVGLVQQDAASKNITVAATTGGGVVDVTGTDGARKVTGVADGDVSATSTDAVTDKQLNATNQQVTQNTADVSTLNTSVTNLDGRVTTNETNITNLQSQIGNGTVGLVQQDAASKNIMVAATSGGNTVNLTGTDGMRKLSGVADGDVSATSTDAVTGKQLNAVNTQVTQNINDIATLNTSVTNLDGRVSTNATHITSLQSQIGKGTVGLVQQDATSKSITVAAATGGNVMDMSGANGARKITGVADGDLSATSAELVNGKQVNATNQQVIDNTTQLSAIDASVTNIDHRVTTSTNTVTNLQSQLANGTVGLVQQDAASGNLTMAAQKDGDRVDLRGTDGERVMSGVANGTQDADAVAFGQLKAAGVVDPGGNPLLPLTYDDLSLASARLGGVNGTVIDNVAAGRIAAGSMQAVNGGQLYGVQQGFQSQFDALNGQVGQLNDRVGAAEQGVAKGSNGAPGNSGGGTVGGPGSGDNSVVVGEGANASGSNSAAVGNGASASGNNGSTIGNGSAASGNNATAVGAGASASGDNAVALGADSVADRANSVSVGSVGNERQITNVTAGTAPTDAVNVQQLTGMRDWAQSYTDSRMNAIDSKIGMVGRRANAGTAAAIAMANMPQGYAPGQSAVALGVGTFAGENALAAGLTTISPNGRWVFRASVSANSQGDTGVGFSAGMAW